MIDILLNSDPDKGTSKDKKKKDKNFIDPFLQL
jgi:hypothetical protein